MSKPAPPLESMKSIGWTYWQALIAGNEPPDIHPAFAPPGFYRYDIIDNRNGHRSTVVAIWDEDAQRNKIPKVFRIGSGHPILIDTLAKEEDFCTNKFSRFSRKAITHDVYSEWLRTGEFPKTVADKAIENSRAAAVEEPGVGHNSGDLHAFETFEDQAAAALAGLADAKKVESAEAAKAAQSLRNRLTEIASEGDKAREVEKKPHLDAGRAVDERWNPRIKELRKSASDLRAAIEGFKTREANERRREAERRAAEANPVIPTGEPEKVHGGYGKASTVRMILVPTIVDFDKVYAQMKEVPDVKYALQAALIKVVEKVYANMAPGMPDLDGVTSVERAKIR